MADPLIRRDVWALEEEEGTWHPITEAYALAVGAMQDRAREDPTSWTYQAAVHGVPFGEPTDDWLNQCQHNTWFFLPWHRMYLYWFERIVRAAVQGLDTVSDDVKAEWALPYWNYDRGGQTASLPTAFREPTLADGQTENPLFTPRRERNIARGGRLDPLSVLAEGALGEGFFAHDPIPGGTVGFGGAVTGWNHFDEAADAAPGALEQTPHNLVHGGVGGPGGLMSGFDTAPLDAIFWLHHANIDRLWVEWLKQDGRENPTESSWSGDLFDFHDEDGTPVRMASDEVLDPEQIGYAYEETAVPERLAAGAGGRSAMPTEPPRDGPTELVGATDQPLVLTGDRAQVAIPVAAPTGPALRADTEQAEPQRVYVNVEGIQGDENPGVSYAVYVNLPDDEEPSTAERYHVGNLSFFGIELARDVDRDHPGGHGLRYAFDITDLVKELREQGRWDPERVTVTFSPLRPLPPPGDEVAAERAESTPPVRIGRVGIYYQ